MDKSRLTNALKPLTTLAVVGGAWGDEGKGKIIDLLAGVGNYDHVVRYGGGGNAGHTTYVPEGKLVMHLIPCGLAQRKVCVISAGVLFDIESFLKELAQAKETLGDSLPEIWIDEKCTVCTPWHKLLEAWMEHVRGKDKIGTTHQGISPMASIKAARVDVKVADLFMPKQGLEKILELLHKTYFPILNKMELRKLVPSVPTLEEVSEQLIELGQKIKPFVRDTRFDLYTAWKGGKRILFEGAQAQGLDPTWGTAPYVSSGNSIAGGVSVGTGLPPKALSDVMLVTKILPTRVGEGPFPTEIWTREGCMNFPKQFPELFRPTEMRGQFLAEARQAINSNGRNPQLVSNYFQALGMELGATSGRGRSVGYPDIPLLQYAAQLNEPKYLALTRLDMLSGMKEIPVAVSYKYRNSILPPGKMPDGRSLHKVEPIYESWPCWTEDISGIQEEDELPVGTRDFLKRLEDHLKVPILVVGTGSGREDAVVRKI